MLAAAARAATKATRGVCDLGLLLAPGALVDLFRRDVNADAMLLPETRKKDADADGKSKPTRPRRPLAESEAAAFGFVLALFIASICLGVLRLSAGGGTGGEGLADLAGQDAAGRGSTRGGALKPDTLTLLVQMSEDLHKRALYGGGGGHGACAEGFLQALTTSMEPRAAQARATVEGVFNALETETALDREILQQGLEQARGALSHMRAGVLQDLDRGVKEQKRAWDDLARDYETSLRRVNSALLRLGVQASDREIEKLRHEHFLYHPNGVLDARREPVRLSHLAVSPVGKRDGDLFFAKALEVLADTELRESARACVKQDPGVLARESHGPEDDAKAVKGLGCAQASQRALIDALGVDVPASSNDQAILAVLRYILLGGDKVRKLEAEWRNGKADVKRRVLSDLYGLAKAGNVPRIWLSGPLRPN